MLLFVHARAGHGWEFSHLSLPQTQDTVPVRDTAGRPRTGADSLRLASEFKINKGDWA